MKLIDKDALVAEIEKLKEMYCYDTKTNASFIAEAVINSINNAINSIEVKEVDLENELKEDWLFADKTEVDCLESMYLTEGMFVSLAKKYFQLGLKAQKGE